MSKKPAKPARDGSPTSPRGAGAPSSVEPGAAAPSSPTKTSKMKFLVHTRGNNGDPILRALASRGNFWGESLTDIPAGTPATDASQPPQEYWTSNFVWKPTWARLKPPPPEYSRGNRDLRRRQVVNHILAVEPLCNKHTLCTTMMTYYKGIGEDPFDVLPFTILVVLKGTDPSRWLGWTTFVEAYKRYAAKPGCKNMWLLKPTMLNRGIGIEVHKDMSEIMAFLSKKAAKLAANVTSQAPPGANTWVLQKYIENPLLIKGRKFDLRIWVLLTDEGDVYLYLPGYVRTSSEAFSLDSEYKYIHLTNYCQQKYAPSFGSFEDGNTLTFAQFEEYLEELRATGKAPGEKPLLENVIMPQIKRIVCDTFRSLQGRGGSTSTYIENGFGKKPAASSNHRFELLGYDFMVDTQYKVWFIEINTNPSISYQNTWHEHMVDIMIDQTFDLVVDPAFPGSVSSRTDKPPTVLSAGIIPTLPRKGVPREGIAALDCYEEAVAGLEAVQKELGGGPSSDDAAAAGVTVAVTSGTSLWASLAPGWQPLMNVYKHRSKSDLPWSPQPSVPALKHPNRAVLSPTPTALVTAQNSPVRAPHIKPLPLQHTGDHTIVPAGGPVFLVGQKPPVSPTGGDRPLVSPPGVDKRLAMSPYARPSTTEPSPRRQSHSVAPTDRYVTVAKLANTGAASPNIRPSTAAGGSPYSGSLSARRAKQMGLATMDSLTLKAAIAAALQYRGDQRPRRDLPMDPKAIGATRSKSQAPVRAKVLRPPSDTAPLRPAEPLRGSVNLGKQPPPSPIRISETLGLSISQSQLLNRTVSAASLKATGLLPTPTPVSLMLTTAPPITPSGPAQTGFTPRAPPPPTSASAVVSPITHIRRKSLREPALTSATAGKPVSITPGQPKPKVTATV